jgi:hypothetical protein
MRSAALHPTVNESQPPLLEPERKTMLLSTQ